MPVTWGNSFPQKQKQTQDADKFLLRLFWKLNMWSWLLLQGLSFLWAFVQLIPAVIIMVWVPVCVCTRMYTFGCVWGSLHGESAVLDTTWPSLSISLLGDYAIALICCLLSVFPFPFILVSRLRDLRHPWSVDWAVWADHQGPLSSTEAFWDSAFHTVLSQSCVKTGPAPDRQCWCRRTEPEQGLLVIGK